MARELVVPWSSARMTDIRACDLERRDAAGLMQVFASGTPLRCQANGINLSALWDLCAHRHTTAPLLSEQVRRAAVVFVNFLVKTVPCQQGKVR